MFCWACCLLGVLGFCLLGSFIKRKRGPVVARVAWLAAPLVFAPTTPLAACWRQMYHIA